MNHKVLLKTYFYIMLKFYSKSIKNYRQWKPELMKWEVRFHFAWQHNYRPCSLMLIISIISTMNIITLTWIEIYINKVIGDKLIQVVINHSFNRIIIFQKWYHYISGMKGFDWIKSFLMQLSTIQFCPLIAKF